MNASEKVKPKSESVEAKENYSGWTFLTNHTHVLVCLSRDEALTIRALADKVGITERSVQRILAELQADGVISSRKIGRNNVYEINEGFQLRHPLESHQTLGQLLGVLK